MYKNETPWWRTVESAAVCLFALQAVRALFSMLFAQVYDAMFDGRSVLPLLVGMVCLCIMVAMPLFSPKQRPRISPSLRIAAVLTAFMRAPMSIDLPLLRMATAALTLGFAGYYVAGMLRQHAQVLPSALGLAAFVDQCLRAWGHTYDLSIRPWWILVQIGLSLGVIVLAERLLKKAPREAGQHEGGFAAGIAFGASLFLVSSLFGLPNAASRWTGASYTLFAVAMMLPCALPLIPVAQRIMQASPMTSTRWPRVVLLFVLVGSLAVADMGMAPLNTVLLLVSLVLFWLVLPGALSLGSHNAPLGVTLGLVALLVLGTVHALSFTYAYTLDIFRGAALPVFVIGVLLSAGLILIPSRLTWLPSPTPPSNQLKYWLFGAGGAFILVCAFALPRRLVLPTNSDAARLGTYNIHYGYNTTWRMSLAQQAKTIAASQADVVALQEVDTGRLTSYGVDTAYWLGRKLGMEVVYLPTVEHTTGIALLSQLDIGDHGGMLLPSAEEPTGIIHATITVDGAWLRTHAVWLGLSSDERARQIDAALPYMGGGVTSLAGDLNSTPDSPVHAKLVAAGYIDPFQLPAFHELPTSPAIRPQERIDYVWLRGVDVTEAQVLPSLASDHRMVVVKIE